MQVQYISIRSTFGRPFTKCIRSHYALRASPTTFYFLPPTVGALQLFSDERCSLYSIGRYTILCAYVRDMKVGILRFVCFFLPSNKLWQVIIAPVNAALVQSKRYNYDCKLCCMYFIIIYWIVCAVDGGRDERGNVVGSPIVIAPIQFQFERKFEVCNFSSKKKKERKIMIILSAMM